MTLENLIGSDNNDQIDIDPNKNYLEELVGPGKKFATVEDLARGKFLADATIRVRERRLDELQSDYVKLRQEATAGASLKEQIDHLSERLLASRDNNPNPNEDTNKPSQLELKDVESLVSSQLMRHEQTKKENDNFNFVKGKLTERFGNNYKDVLKDQATALGLTDEQVNKMARETPNLFIKTFDLNTPTGQNGFQAPVDSGVRSAGFSPQGKEKRTWSYYLKMKEKDPKAWFDKKIAVQMDKDAQALGDAFYDV